MPYGYVRKLCFDTIKGKRKPASFHFTFLCPQKLLREIIEGQSLSIQPSEVANLTPEFTLCRGRITGDGRLHHAGIFLWIEAWKKHGKHGY